METRRLWCGYAPPWLSWGEHDRKTNRNGVCSGDAGAGGMGAGVGVAGGGEVMIGLFLLLAAATVTTPVASDGVKAIKALTEGAATAVVVIPVERGYSARGVIEYLVIASDKEDQQVRHGRVSFVVVNNNGSEHCLVASGDGPNPTEHQDGSEGLNSEFSAGTLTYQWSMSSARTNACELDLIAWSSLKQTRLEIRFFVRMGGFDDSE